MARRRLRDRALIGVMVYSFARVGAVITMRVKDYYRQGKRCVVSRSPKPGAKGNAFTRRVASATTYRPTTRPNSTWTPNMDAYITAACIADDKNGSLFRTTRGKTDHRRGLRTR